MPMFGFLVHTGIEVLAHTTGKIAHNLSYQLRNSK